MGYITKGSCEETIPPKKQVLVCLIFGVIFLCLAVFTMIVNPIMIMVKIYSRADYGTKVHEVLSREADSIHVSTYLFNITNAEQFLSGEDDKLNVEEVGPFTYQENRTNENLVFDKEAEVIRYTPTLKTTFLPEESIGDPKDMIVTMPNLAFLAMASELSSYGYLAKLGFNLLTNRLMSNATVTMNAHDYIWGYEEPLIKVGNQILPGWINFNKLGILDRIYDKNITNKLEVSSRHEDKFMIKTFNGAGGLNVWGYGNPEKRTNCNSFHNAFEGMGYPPNLTPNRPMKIYRNVLCRFLELEYHSKWMMDFGVEGFYYKISNKTYTNIPENQCLCSKGVCYEGVSDLSPCFYGFPLVLSNAHFLDADPAIYKKIGGLKPNEEEHGSAVVIDPIIGMVMNTNFTVQINVMVKDIGFNSKVSKFSNMFVPAFYLKIRQPRIPEDRIATLRLAHVYGPYMLLAFQITLFLTGLLLLSHAVRLLYWSWLYSRRKTIKLQTKDPAEISKEPLMTS